MATYRYFLCDLMSNNLIQELPLEGVTFSRQLSAVGNFQAAFGLDRTGYRNDIILDATMPGKTCVYVDRDGALVWGGIIWSRTWAEQSKSLQFTAQTFDSYFDKTDIEQTLAYVNVDQRNILLGLISNLQAKNTRNLNIVLPDPFPTDIVRSIRFNSYEVWTYGKALESLLSLDSPVDYYIDVRYNAQGQFERFLQVDNVLGNSVDNTSVIYNYPGNVKNYWYPENAAKGATTVKGIGAGEGSSMFRSAAVNNSLTKGGYPELVEFYTDKSVMNQTLLDSKTLQEAQRLQVPVTVPTIEVNPNMEPQFGSFNLGDYARVNVESSRFPAGKEFTTRIIGWNVTPTRGDSQEDVQLVLQGADDV